MAIVSLAASIVLFHTFPRDRETPGPTPEGAALHLPAAPQRDPEPETLEPPPVSPELANAAPSAPPCQEVSEWVENPLTGELSPRHQCTPEAPAADPYQDLDEATLAGMAYGDARAAAVLGLRKIRSHDTVEEDLGLSLIYRSAALSGDLEVFRRAIGLRYAYLSVNGRPQVEGMKQLLIFNRMGRALGDDRFDPEPVRSELTRIGLSAEEIGLLESRSRTILGRMAALQTELTGRTDFREVLEDA
jgi:hypothetical protein